MCLVILVGHTDLCDTVIPLQIADPETCDRMYESLVRIHTNYYKNKYPRLKDTSFTGLTVEDCKMILATDILKQMEDMKKGTWKKLREKFSAKKPEEDSK
ncbi:PREDICTED: ubiquinol-cytochrome-c reductase complex assembly factor 2 [Nipponia nippon]|uniref:ubiquinol-cytochrome-c reductase complex assembly factor 2 n=1 Tax=Nipponia nippon TaxID=128390 RepID=UPI000510E55E|nr:PREDICTED: ubiquinol-cytochrome-c reductase complex assembly factor 2 [Nipponia nippon]